MDLEQLKNILKGETVILGIGNPLKGDDGAGSEIARRLEGKLNISVFDGGTVPENLLAKIISIRPESLLIIEAISRNETAASLKIFLPGDFARAGISKNYMSLSIFLDILRHKLPDTDIYILGIEPKDNLVASSFSGEVKTTLDRLENFFHSNYGKDSCNSRVQSPQKTKTAE